MCIYKLLLKLDVSSSCQYKKIVLRYVLLLKFVGKLGKRLEGFYWLGNRKSIQRRGPLYFILLDVSLLILKCKWNRNYVCQYL